MAKNPSRKKSKKKAAAKKASANVAKKRRIPKIDCLDEANDRLKAAHENREREYAAEIKKLDDKEEELRLRLSKLEEQKEKVAADHGETEVSDDDLVEVNAGGKIVSARRGVLCQLKGTKLEALFSGRWDKKLQRDSSGRIFLDINGDCFQAIVDYLKELIISAEEEQPLPPSTVGGGENMQMLHDHLQLFDLSHPFTSESKIIKESCHAAAIDNWLEEDGSAGVMNLLYRSSTDGLSAESFHNKCDGNGDSDKDRTLVLIETEEGGIVGGYSNRPWDSSGDYEEADKAFLFVLSGFDISSPCKMKLYDDEDNNAIYCDEDSGPTFGNGHDIIVDESSVSLRMGYSYQEGPTKELNDGKYYNIKELEVFQVSDTCMTKKQVPPSSQNEVAVVDRFTGEINDAINEKWLKLQELEEEVRSLEESFKDEENFIDSIGSGDTNDIVMLNVSGTRMTTNRAVLMYAEDSVLAQQFDDTKWTEQGCKDMRVKDWEPDEVVKWVKRIKDIPDTVAELFIENEITGSELISLDKEGLKMLGVTRVGTICLLADEIITLKKTSSEGMVTLIEHSPYCFGKILDYLRMKYLHSIGLIDNEPALPTVCDDQKKRFEKVVKYYFPGESSNFILG